MSSLGNISPSFSTYKFNKTPPTLKKPPVRFGSHTDHWMNMYQHITQLSQSGFLRNTPEVNIWIARLGRICTGALTGLILINDPYYKKEVSEYFKRIGNHP